jgi:hypothetical protein
VRVWSWRIFQICLIVPLLFPLHADASVFDSFWVDVQLTSTHAPSAVMHTVQGGTDDYSCRNESTMWMEGQDTVQGDTDDYSCRNDSTMWMEGQDTVQGGTDDYSCLKESTMWMEGQDTVQGDTDEYSCLKESTMWMEGTRYKVALMNTHAEKRVR